MLILFRVIQGAVAGPIIPLSQSLLMRNYPVEKRNMALALWAMTVVVAPICGPILGGWISDNYHWGWIFFINIPIGISILLISLKVLKNRETPIQIKPIDMIGLSLLVLGIGCLQVMLDKGKDLDWFNSSEIIVLTVLSVVSLSFLIVWELTEKNPIVDFSLFSSRNFSIGILCISLAYMFYSGLVILLPELLQTVFGYTATITGLAAAPIGIIPVLLSGLIGKYGGKIDLRLIVSFSFIMFIVCFLWRTYTFEPGMSFSVVVLPQFVQGFAVACFFMPLSTIILSNAPDSKLAEASSLSNFFRTLAGSIGTSITTTLWTQREAIHHAHMTESITPYNPAVQSFYQQAENMGLSHSQASTYLAQQITSQGLIISANELFWLSACVFIVLLLLIWFTKPPFNSSPDGGAAH
jgi:DHA2 family multidrug resistance protein